MRRTVLEFLPLADVVKISDEELEFLTGTSDIEAALPSLFVGHVQLVLYTCGSAGAHAYTRTAHGFSASKPVKAVDTTGAGDGFIGSFLWQLHKNGVDRAALPALQADQLNQWLDFSTGSAVTVCSATVPLTATPPSTSCNFLPFSAISS